MPIIDVIIPAALQGVTEFIPISSSAVLLAYSFLQSNVPSPVALDIVLHFGTLLAVCIAVRAQLASLVLGIINGDKKVRPLFYFLCTASIPIILFGALVYKTGTIDLFRNLQVVALTTIFFGLLLILSDRTKEKRNTHPSHFLGVCAVGLTQALSIIPGVSRSGAVITALRYYGVSRAEAIDLALLLSIPTIGGSMILAAVSTPFSILFSVPYVIGMVVACGIALYSISLMRALVAWVGFAPFGYIRIGLGLLLFMYIYMS